MGGLVMFSVLSGISIDLIQADHVKANGCILTADGHACSPRMPPYLTLALSTSPPSFTDHSPQIPL